MIVYDRRGHRVRYQGNGAQSKGEKENRHDFFFPLWK